MAFKFAFFLFSSAYLLFRFISSLFSDAVLLLSCGLKDKIFDFKKIAVLCCLLLNHKCHEVSHFIALIITKRSQVPSSQANDASINPIYATIIQRIAKHRLSNHNNHKNAHDKLTFVAGRGNDCKTKTTTHNASIWLHMQIDRFDMFE